MSIKWLKSKQIQIDPPKKTKKITGTRLGAILGANQWKTPFSAWCEITRTYEEPFEDTKYTIAGKTIEPKQADYIEKMYQLDIVRPSDVYGEDYFNKTYGDFYPQDKVCGGMWDYLVKEDGETVGVIECKTSSRPQDWEDDIPEHYALQASLYAYLLKIDQVYMEVSFLKETDYVKPNNFKCTSKNTKIIPFKVSERYPNFKKIYNKAIEWYETYVESGISPKYDEVKDKDILNALKTISISPDLKEKDIISEAEELLDKIEKIDEKKKPLEERLKVLKEKIKEDAIGKLGKNDKKVIVDGCKYIFTLNKSVRDEVDKELMKKKGIYEKYITQKETYTLTNKIKEEK